MRQKYCKQNTKNSNDDDDDNNNNNNNDNNINNKHKTCNNKGCNAGGE